MLSKALIAPFVFGALIFLYLAWDVRSDYALYILPFAIGIVVVYMLGPQIDWWWYQRRPPELPGMLRHLINTKFPFYQKLGLEDKTRFRNRMALYMVATEFMPKGMENVPVDVKGVIAASVVQLTFGLEDYRLSKFERIVVYPHPFPSPQYPEKWHASENYAEDGVIMFSAEQLMPAFLQPQRYFHTGLYEYARVFRQCYPGADFPPLGENDWGTLEQVSGFSKEKIVKWINLPEVDITAVAVAHFFVFPERFKAALPDVYRKLAAVFRQDLAY